MHSTLVVLHAVFSQFYYGENGFDAASSAFDGQKSQSRVQFRSKIRINLARLLTAQVLKYGFVSRAEIPPGHMLKSIGVVVMCQYPRRLKQAHLKNGREHAGKTDRELQNCWPRGKDLMLHGKQSQRLAVAVLRTVL